MVVYGGAGSALHRRHLVLINGRLMTRPHAGNDASLPLVPGSGATGTAHALTAAGTGRMGIGGLFRRRPTDRPTDQPTDRLATDQPTRRPTDQPEPTDQRPGDRAVDRAVSRAVDRADEVAGKFNLSHLRMIRELVNCCLQEGFRLIGQRLVGL